jgi:SAM-dependent MidA family methyltransferase
LTDSSLPAPSPAAQAASQQLVSRIHAEISAGGGWLGFDRYMRRALYEPGLGYYSGGSVKFGATGDFVTAPELGDLLAQAVAQQFAGMLGNMVSPYVLELGAGTGRLAADLLDALDARGLSDLPYRILEPSAELQQRQQQLLARFGARVTWLSELPSADFDGLILANEVADALPVARFAKQDGRALPLGVAAIDENLVWRAGAFDTRIDAAVRKLEQQIESVLPDGYRSELCLMLHDWLAAVVKPLRSGAMLLIDYGLVRREYYHPERADGTLICHYRPRAHVDPFWWPGLQDISAWVDFSRLADAGRAAGLAVQGFTTQGQFLLESAARLESGSIDFNDPRQLSALKTLVLPGEMGERFKALLLTRHCDELTLPGRDFRNRL